jgi:hypothetical protein
MTIRHAAALALVGWYLMVPPAIPGTHEVNQSAPLSQWTLRRMFPRNQGCETAKAPCINKRSPRRLKMTRQTRGVLSEIPNYTTSCVSRNASEKMIRASNQIEPSQPAMRAAEMR